MVAYKETERRGVGGGGRGRKEVLDSWDFCICQVIYGVNGAEAQ